MRFSIASSIVIVALAQQPTPPAAPSESAGGSLTWTTAEDHRNMMEQLGITSLRPSAAKRSELTERSDVDGRLFIGRGRLSICVDCR